MKDKPCPKCGSSDIIEDGRIMEYFNDWRKCALGVTVYSNPDAWIFRGATVSKLTVWVCGACGYTELYVKTPQKLWEAYQKQQGES